MSAILFSCPGCRARLQVKDLALAGRSIRCPRCSAAVAVPGGEPEGPAGEQGILSQPSAPPARPAPPPDRDEPIPTVLPVRRGPTPPGRRLSPLLVAGSAVALLLVVALAVWAVVALWPAGADDGAAVDPRQVQLVDDPRLEPLPPAEQARRAREREETLQRLRRQEQAWLAQFRKVRAARPGAPGEGPAPLVVFPPPKKNDTAVGLAYAPDGKALAVGRLDGSVEVLGLPEGRLLWSQPTPALRMLAFSPDGSLLAAASDRDTVRFWDARTGQVRGALRAEKHEIKCLGFSPDGKRLATGGPVMRPGASALRVWDVARGEVVLGLPEAKEVQFVAFAPDGRTVAAGTWGSELVLWNARTGARVWRTEVAGRARGVFSHDSKYLACRSAGDPALLLWDVETKQARLCHLDGANAEVVGFSPDGKLLVGADTAGGEVELHFWEVKTGNHLPHRRLGRGNFNQQLVLSPGGSFLAMTRDGGEVALWSVEELLK
jgi:hypothetical protein